MAQPTHRTSEDRPFRIGVLAGAGLLAVVMIWMRFGYEVAIVKKPPEPEAEDLTLDEVNQSVGTSPAIYAGYLEKDSQTYGISPPVTIEAMSAVMPHQVDDTRHRLEPRGSEQSIESLGLRITASVRRIEGRPRKMTVLTIENLTDRDLAYNIVTKPSHGTRACHQKQHLRHNAVAVEAHGKQVRSECMYGRGWSLEITRIETVALPRLSFFYVSRVPPEVFGVETRVGRGHQPPRGSPCNVVLPATIQNARTAGRVTWRDLIDFFARHRCETYRFLEEYQAFEQDSERSLPAGSDS